MTAKEIIKELEYWIEIAETDPEVLIADSEDDRYPDEIFDIRPDGKGNIYLIIK